MCCYTRAYDYSITRSRNQIRGQGAWWERGRDAHGPQRQGGVGLVLGPGETEPRLSPLLCPSASSMPLTISPLHSSPFVSQSVNMSESVANRSHSWPRSSSSDTASMGHFPVQHLQLRPRALTHHSPAPLIGIPPKDTTVCCLGHLRQPVALTPALRARQILGVEDEVRAPKAVPLSVHQL